MANCDDDDDFSIYSDENTPQHHHPHNHIHPHRPYAPPQQLHAPPPTSSSSNYPETTSFCSPTNLTTFTTENPNGYNNNQINDSTKRKEINEGSDGYNCNSNKRRLSSCEYQKDREEWSDAAISSLLEAYTEKFNQLNRGNLRGRDWEEVAVAVSERCGDKGTTKSVEQCKNKVDNLKKRYKLERHRMSSGGILVSHWPWFKHLEEIIGNSVSVKGAGPMARTGMEEDKGSSGGSRQSKRYAVTVHNSIGQVNIVKSKSMSNPRWRRVVFKVSGAALVGTGPNNMDPKVTMIIAREVAIACRLGVEVAIVIGGRNFFCGDTWVTATGVDRSTAYQIGMMATVMNSVLLQSAIENAGVEARLQSAISVQDVAEPYNRQRAIRHLEKRRVVIFGGIGAGTGNPLFSTDTAAALQALEIHAEAVLKGTNVDGVYDCNSANTNATFEHITFRELVSRGGATPMDMMAITYCEENAIPVVVFNLLQPGNISRALCGDQVGTLIDQTGRVT